LTNSPRESSVCSVQPVGDDRVDYPFEDHSVGSASQVSNLVYSKNVIWTRVCFAQVIVDILPVSVTIAQQRRRKSVTSGDSSAKIEVLR
jgi:hypothetical protein